jgi:4-hydroxymandelate oxidase
MQALSLRELEAEARPRLAPAIYEFFAGGSGDEITLRANEAAFGRLGLVPRVLTGAAHPDLGINLLGCAASMPVLIAPTAFHRLAHAEGESATARAAAGAGTIMIVSMASTVAVANVAASARAAAGAVDASLWFQIYIQPDLAFTEAIVQRAEAAGCRALVVTVDSPAFGRRERDLRNGFMELPDGMCCENLREPRRGNDLGQARPIEFVPELSWEHIDWLRSVTALPIALKGVMHPEDARIAVDRGVDAVVVSNHGGRQLDSVPATIDLLPVIANAVGGRVPLVLDGGVRRGTDVIKALALGASAVAIGRPVLWGLALDGTHGVSRVLEMLRSELQQALTLCGCRSLHELDRSLVRLSRIEEP